jgi:hypothetical protein
MRTTIDLPDPLFRRAKARAALSGLTLKELITRWVERGLREDEGPPAASGRSVRALPVVILPAGRRMPALTNAQIEAVLAEDEAGTAGDHAN